MDDLVFIEKAFRHAKAIRKALAEIKGKAGKYDLFNFSQPLREN